MTGLLNGKTRSLEAKTNLLKSRHVFKTARQDWKTIKVERPRQDL